MTWHADPATLARWTAGGVDAVTASSVEAHLTGCAKCRDALAAYADDDRLDRTWAAVVDTLDLPRPTVAERGLRALRVRPDHARLLAATPSLRASWLLSVALVATFAVAAGRATRSGDLLFLLVAPLVPVAGVAAAYGPGVDPAYEVGVAAPFGGVRLLLLRSVAVLSVSFLCCGAAGLALPGLAAAGWLLPGLALSAATLAASTVTPPAFAAGGVSAAWLAYVSVRTDHPADGVTQVLAALLLVAGVAVLVWRAAHFEGGERA
jgi:predicted anti-sigma-YlaC factor YlaD